MNEYRKASVYFTKNIGNPDIDVQEYSDNLKVFEELVAKATPMHPNISYTCGMADDIECGRCGNDLDGDFKYCPHCGQKIKDLKGTDENE